MFFLLSKILSFVVMPLTVICGLLTAAVIVKRQPLRKRLLVLVLSLLVFFTNDFISNEVMRQWEVPVTVLNNMTKTYAWGILLTGVTKYDTGPKDRIYFSGGADRVTHTVQLYKLGRIQKILVSGGSGNLDAPERKEALEIADALVLMGVSPNDIVTESDSRNTHESVEKIKKILEDKTTPAECLLITSAYHMRRSMACFKKVNWNVDAFSVDFHSHFRKYTFNILFVPSIESFSNWHILIREWLGMIAYKAAGYI